MATRYYDRILECGCMLSSDGGGGLLSCHAEYGDFRKKKDREAMMLCKKSWKKFHESKDYKLYLKECKENNE